MMNPQALMQVMAAWNTFKGNHPKFPAFMEAIARQGIQEDSIIEIAVTSPDGNKIETNLKVKQSDLDLFNSFRNMQ